MKNIILLALTWTMLADCGKGYVPYENVCAEIPQSSGADYTAKPSDEKPSKHPEAAYDRGDVKAAMPASLAGQDAKLDSEKSEADAEGKAKAGIKQIGE